MIHITRSLVLFLVIILINLINGYSQTKRDNIIQFVKVVHLDTIATYNVKRAIAYQINKKSFTLQDTSAVTSFIKSLKPEREKIVIDIINEDLLAYIDTNFTNQELIALIGFYSTPHGQKCLAIFHQLERIIIIALHEKHIPELIKRIDEFEKQLHQKK